MKKLSDKTEATLLISLMGIICVLAALVADFTARVGIFYYRNEKYDVDRSAQAYCNALPNVFQKSPPGTKCEDGSQCDADHKKYDSCQQWRSAQANEKSAGYSALSFIVGGMGVFLALVATAAAAAAARFTWTCFSAFISATST